MALLAATLLFACGRDPGPTERVVTVAEMPSPEQVAPAHARADALERFYQVQWFGAVARWSWVVTVHYAAAVDGQRTRQRDTEQDIREPTIAKPQVRYRGQGDTTWDRLAACESSGDWGAATGNGYFGGLQFTLSTWRAYGLHPSPVSGYVPMPNEASRSTQIAVAERVLAGQGPGAWPVCSYRAGLR